jgi:hypothetical protein
MQSRQIAGVRKHRMNMCDLRSAVNQTRLLRADPLRDTSSKGHEGIRLQHEATPEGHGGVLPSPDHRREKVKSLV